MSSSAPSTGAADRRLMVQAEPLLVSAKDAARLCGVSERTWRGWGRKRALPRGGAERRMQTLGIPRATALGRRRLRIQITMEGAVDERIKKPEPATLGVRAGPGDERKTA